MMRWQRAACATPCAVPSAAAGAGASPAQLCTLSDAAHRAAQSQTWRPRQGACGNALPLAAARDQCREPRWMPEPRGARACACACAPAAAEREPQRAVTSRGAEQACAAPRRPTACCSLRSFMRPSAAVLGLGRSLLVPSLCNAHHRAQNDSTAHTQTTAFVRAVGTRCAPRHRSDEARDSVQRDETARPTGDVHVAAHLRCGRGCVGPALASSPPATTAAAAAAAASFAARGCCCCCSLRRRRFRVATMATVAGAPPHLTKRTQTYTHT